MLDDGGAGFRRAGDDVDDAFRQFRLLKDLRQLQQAQAGGLGRLDDDGVAAGDGGRDLPRGHQQRKIPWNDLPGDAERARMPARERVRQLVRPAGVIEKVRGYDGEVHVAAFLDGLAAVHGFEHGSSRISPE